jgi:hypothetical protein
MIARKFIAPLCLTSSDDKAQAVSEGQTFFDRFRLVSSFLRRGFTKSEENIGVGGVRDRYRRYVKENVGVTNSVTPLAATFDSNRASFALPHKILGLSDCIR